MYMYHCSYTHTHKIIKEKNESMKLRERLYERSRLSKGKEKMIYYI